MWIDSSGQQITSAGDIIVSNPMISGLQTNRSLYFDPIRTRDGGTYTCAATLPSPVLSTPLNTSAIYTINVQLSKKTTPMGDNEHLIYSFAAFPIPVTITGTGVLDQSPLYTPGSSAQFMCSASGQFGLVVTTWTSSCTASCFVLQQSAQQSIMKDILHAVDSGNHTCTVVDDVGNTGSSTIELLVSGTYIFDRIM